MSLSGLLDALRRRPAYRRLVEALRAGGPAPVRLDPLDGAKPYLIAALWRDLARPLLWIVPAPDDARRAYDQLLPYLPPAAASACLLCPEPDALPYERLASDATTTRDRLRVLAVLAGYGQGEVREAAKGASPLGTPFPRGADGSPRGTPLGGPPIPPLVIASGHAAAQVTLAPELFRRVTHAVHVGERLAVEELLARWVAMGYEAVPAVEVPGAFSRRGGIMDVWSPGGDMPARIELSGGVVESLRLFDPATQRSKARVESVAIVPARELIAAAVPQASGSDRRWAPDTSGLQPDAREAMQEDLARLGAGTWFPGAEFYAPLFQRATLPDYLSAEAVLVVDRPVRLRAALGELARRGEEVKAAQVERGLLPRDFPSPIVPWERHRQAIEDMSRRLELNPFASVEAEPRERDFGGLGFSAPRTYGGQVSMLSTDLTQERRAGGSIVVASLQAQRLSELLQEGGQELSLREDVDLLPSPATLVLVRHGLAEGWSMGPSEGSPDARLTLLSDAEVFGFVKQPRQVRRRALRRDAFVSDLSLGDYVVHVEHGIARFEGTVRRALDRAEREYLVLAYAEGDTLYVPTDQVDRVGRYVGTGGVPALSRLGGAEWAATKRKVKEAALEYARELLRIYALREVEERPGYGEDTPWQWDLETSFPYQETPDQLQVIGEIKEDMERPKPMDRLLCGDVGYGKTEVALRAAFKAVSSGSQVAVLVPTTVLAQQHYETFHERLKPFPVRVEVLSRLRPAHEQEAVVEAIQRGQVDIVIGTHRLLQKDVGFKNLGLVIVDEEQRFGVEHKEQLKRMRAAVDVLTMTATPIPRTLHMALAGVRDMSRIETPPEERLPVTTYVAEYDDRLVREAVLREMDRGGQVFFVHNRIMDIEQVARRLRDLLPEASLGIAHGRMPPEALERTMEAFARGEITVLLCTTIIQAGLDIPNANTLLVDEADKLGLTQLYQLRGRVGRSSVRAYAYFLYKRDRLLTQTAEQRLRAILSATELGAGFRIAMKDLEIRGAGSVLGTEQSGHMAAVGFDLYTRLLAEAVEELRSQAPTDARGGAERRELLGSGPARPPVELPLDALIPDSYVEETGTRLAIYERLARRPSLAEVAEIRREMADRFGPLPAAGENLLFVVELRARAGELGAVQAITAEGSEIVLRLRPEASGWLDRDALRRAVPEAQVGHLQLRMSMGPGARWRPALRRLLEALETLKAGRIPARAPHSPPTAQHAPRPLTPSP